MKACADLSRGNLVGSECSGEHDGGQDFERFLGRPCSSLVATEEREQVVVGIDVIELHFNCIAPTTPRHRPLSSLILLSSPQFWRATYTTFLRWFSCSSHLDTQAKPFLNLYFSFILFPDVISGRQIQRLATTFCVSTAPTLNALVEFIPWTNTLIAREYSDCSSKCDVDEQSAWWQYLSLLQKRRCVTFTSVVLDIHLTRLPGARTPQS